MNFINKTIIILGRLNEKGSKVLRRNTILGCKIVLSSLILEHKKEVL